MITYAQETLKHAKRDVESLLPEQWAETGDIGIECEPIWPFYESLEKHNALVLVLAREDSRPIGYATGSVYPHPNSRGHLIASIPTWFVEHRPTRALIVRRLLQTSVSYCFEKGARRVSIRTHHEHSAGRLIEAMGGNPLAIEYVMFKSEPVTSESCHA